MAVALNLKLETQAELVALAHRSGVSVEDYLLAVVEGTILSHFQKSLSPEERVSMWREVAKRFPDTPPLSDEAVTRENMYADHE